MQLLVYPVHRTFARQQEREMKGLFLLSSVYGDSMGSIGRSVTGLRDREII